MLNKISIILITFFTNTALAEQAGEILTNNRFEQLRTAIFAEPYLQLPRYKVTRKLFKNTQKDQPSKLFNDAKRTLVDKSDLLEAGRGQKLLQANGICFTGDWIIDQKSTFSGLFKQDTRVPIISRISVSFSGTLQKERRALGIAVKLLPHDLGNQPSMNVFALHSVGGVQTKNVLNLAMDNEPPLGRVPRLADIPTALKLKSDLLKADKEVGSKKPSVTYRTVAPLAEYQTAEYQASEVVAPRWVRFSPLTAHRADQNDFRDELRVENYPDKQIVYAIEVAEPLNQKNRKRDASWQTIGQLVLSESVTSDACDTRLHFTHPKN